MVGGIGIKGITFVPLRGTENSLLNNLIPLESIRFKLANWGVFPLEGPFPKGNRAKSYVCAGARAYARGPKA